MTGFLYNDDILGVNQSDVMGLLGLYGEQYLLLLLLLLRLFLGSDGRSLHCISL